MLRVGIVWSIAFLALLTLIPEATSQVCRDRENYWNCFSWMQYGYCDTPGYRRSMYRLCQRTCGFCHIVSRRTTTTQGPSTTSLPTTTIATTIATTTPPTTVTTTRPAPTTTAAPTIATAKRPEECKDSNDYCVRYRSSGYCATTHIYYQFMTQKCAKTCGFCKGECKDLNSNCPTWKQYCVRTGEYWSFMERNCQKTCKLCDSEEKTGVKNKGKAQFQCDFEKDLCQWTNQHHNDEADWKVGIDHNGPKGGADKSSNYVFLDTAFRSYKGRLILPWVLVMPLKETSTRTMCFTFKYNIRNGSLKVYEQRMPSINEFSPKSTTLLNLDNINVSTWKEAKVTITMNSMKMLYIEGRKTKSDSTVSLDEFAFYNGRC